MTTLQDLLNELETGMRERRLESLRVARLEEVADVFKGGRFSGNHCFSGDHSPRYTPPTVSHPAGPHPIGVLGPNDISPDGACWKAGTDGSPKLVQGGIGSPKCFLQERAHIVAKDHDFLKAGDLLHPRSATLRKVGVVGRANCRLLASAALLVIRPKQNVQPCYLVQLLRSKPYRTWITSQGSAPTGKHIHVKELRSLRIPLPDVKTQNRLGLELTRFDDAEGVLRKFLHTESGGLRKLFGTEADYERNVEYWLQARFDHLGQVDDKMSGFIRIAIQNVRKPEILQHQMRAVTNRALDIIWEHECPNRTIPATWFSRWEESGVRKHHPRMPASRLPEDNRGEELWILRLMADRRNKTPTRVSCFTYYLINFLKPVGDYFQHKGKASFHFGVVVCLAAIQLCEHLHQDFSEHARRG
jgi:hypothetical protein